MSEKESKFQIWWTSPKTKGKVGAAYSLGAAIVIVGALFKIQHWPFASEMLTVGMTVEAILFALGMLDKPHKDYHWENVYDFESGVKTNSGSVSVAGGAGVGIGSTESLSEADTKKLSESIRNLSNTAQQLNSLADVAASSTKLTKSLDEAAQSADKFKSNQDILISSTNNLANAYAGISDTMDAVEKNTKAYSTKIDDVNKKLSSINSIYEIHVKNIQTQSEGISSQNEQLKALSSEISNVIIQTQKVSSSTAEAAQSADLYKANTAKLAKQVSDLNQVYGNMLNSLN